MAVPYSLSRRIVLSSKKSGEVVRSLTDQSGKFYKLDGTRYMKSLPNGSDKNKHINNSDDEL